MLVQLFCLFYVSYALPWGEVFNPPKPARPEFVLPDNVVPFDIVSKYAKLSYCEPLFEKDTSELTVLSVVGTRCANLTISEANSSLIKLAYTDPETGHRSIVAVNPTLKSIFVSFKGMQTIGEKWNTIQFFLENFATSQDEHYYSKTDIKGMKIHRGFRHIWSLMKPKIIPAVDQVAKQYPDYKIIFNGHSLGGSVSSVFAVDFYDSTITDPNRIFLYTFGQLRVGNSIWAQYVNSLPFSKNIYRMAVRADPVHHLPFNFLGYEHFKQIYQVVDNKVYTCENNPGTGESEQCLNDISFELSVANHMKYWYLVYKYV